MIPSAWIDTMAEPQRRLPDNLDDAIDYVSNVLGVPIYMRWSPATLDRHFPSMIEAKNALPEVFHLLIEAPEVVQFWHAGMIVAMTLEEAPSREQIFEHLLRTLSARFRLAQPEAAKRTTHNESARKGERQVASVVHSIDDEPWLARAGRFFNTDRSTNTLNSTDDSTALRAFLADRASRSAHTRRAYIVDLRRLIAWCQATHLGPLSNLTRENLLAFRDALPTITAHASARTLGTRSCERALAVVKSLYQYWTKTGYITANPAAELGSSATHRSTLEPKRFLPEQALEACDRWIASWLSATSTSPTLNRRGVILGLYRFTGARLSELAWHNGYPRLHVDGSDWTLEVMGKRQRVRRIPLPDPCVTCIQHYRRSRGLPPEPSSIADMPLVHSTRGDGLGKSGLYRQVKATFEDIAESLPPSEIAGRFALLAASTHWLRHSYVHQLVVRHQVPLPAAQALAGHASVQTTAGYALTDQSQLRKFVLESFRDGPADGTPPPS